MQGVTFDQIGIAVLLILAAINAGTAIMTFVEKIKAAKKPHDEHLAQVAEHDEKLDRDYKMLKEVISRLEILLKGHLLILDHLIQGNHINKLKEHREFIERYLIEN